MSDGGDLFLRTIMVLGILGPLVWLMITMGWPGALPFLLLGLVVGLVIFLGGG